MAFDPPILPVALSRCDFGEFDGFNASDRSLRKDKDPRSEAEGQGEGRNVPRKQKGLYEALDKGADDSTVDSEQSGPPVEALRWRKPPISHSINQNSLM